MAWRRSKGVRDAANARAAKLPESDPLRKQLQQLAADCDALRSKIVATKEGGMITGEERIRELLGQLYGAVTGYDGKPTDYQVARTESLGHELQDVIDDFQKLTQKELPGINAGLKKKKLDSITVLAEAELAEKACGVFAAPGGMVRPAAAAIDQPTQNTTVPGLECFDRRNCFSVGPR
jgi:hypothetical protein